MRARRWRQWAITIGLVLISVWLASLIWGLAGKARLAVGQARDAEREYQQLESRKATLQADLDQLATPVGQDAAIREAFGVARPGEEVIVVVPPAAATATPPKPWWRRAFGWF